MNKVAINTKTTETMKTSTANRTTSGLSKTPMATIPSFFYVGTNKDSINTLSAYFESGFIAENFEAAINLVGKVSATNSVVPDLIFIDLPFSAEATMRFCEFIRQQAAYAGTLIIYNQQRLNTEDLARIRNNGMTCIDDVLDIDNAPADLYVKVSFLKKLKSFETAPAAQQGENESVPFLTMKRVFDVLISLSLIIALLPVFLVIALLIRLESRGPIFYCANRAGKGFRIFKFYKFRSMKVGADALISELSASNQYRDSKENGPKFFKIEKDPRVTRIGSFLRNSSLDELPQLFNVLKGDMSLVGNRPLPLYEAATLTSNEYVERFMAPAGITGLWQIKKRGKSDMSVDERMELDIAYARKRSFGYDMWIMINTPTALLQKSDV